MIYTKPQVLKKLEDFCLQYKNYREAANKLKISESQLSNMRADRTPLSEGVCKKLGIQRVPMYADKVDLKYLDGSQLL